VAVIQASFGLNSSVALSTRDDVRPLQRTEVDMEIVKSCAVLGAVLSLTLSPLASSAEAPIRDIPRPGPLQPKAQGLSNPALKLSESQRTRIDKIMESYLSEVKAQVDRNSAPGAKRGVEAALASKKARDDMTAAVNQVLNESQRNVLKAEEAERAAQGAKAAKAAFAALGAPPKTDPPRGR
jgi:Spy/CpxP family protein refolding chaperone